MVTGTRACLGVGCLDMGNRAFGLLLWKFIRALGLMICALLWATLPEVMDFAKGTQPAVLDFGMGYGLGYGCGIQTGFWALHPISDRDVVLLWAPGNTDLVTALDFGLDMGFTSGLRIWKWGRPLL